MNLNESYEELKKLIKDGEFSWPRNSTEEINSMFLELNILPLQLSSCSLELFTDHIKLLGNIYLSYQSTQPLLFDMEILYENNAIRWTVSISSITNGVTLQSIFGGLPKTFKTGYSSSSEEVSILDELKVSNLKIMKSSDVEKQDYPCKDIGKQDYSYKITGNLEFSNKEAWGMYASFLPEKSDFNGKLGFYRMGTCKFQINVLLDTKFNSNNRGSIQGWGSASLSLKMISHDNEDGVSFFDEKSSVYLLFNMDLPSLSTPILFEAPLFRGSAIWPLQVLFEKGLSVSDIINFFSSLFYLESDSTFLTFPDGLPVLDYFKLYALGFNLRLEENPLESKLFYLDAVISNSKEYTPPIPLFTIKQLSLYFQVSLGKEKEGKPDNLYTAQLYGLFSFKLSGKLNLDLQFDASFPDYLIHAGLYLKESETKLEYNYAEIVNSFASDTGVGTLALASLDLYADVRNRSFELHLMVKDVWEISAGDFEFAIERIYSAIKVSKTTFSIELEGQFLVKLGKDTKAIFLIKAKYDKDWKFEGGLSSGTLIVSDIVSLIFKGEVSENPIFNVSLTKLWVIFATGKDSFFSINAAMEVAWNIDLLGEKLQLKGEIYFLKKKEITQVDVSGEISLGAFLIAVTAKNATSKTPSYFFKIQYDTLFLEAKYEKVHKGEPSTIHEILSISLGGMTVKGLIEYVGNLMNPNADFTLPAPWDVLGKISLSQFSLTLDFTDKTVYFLYKANLNIAGLIQIDEVGISYNAKKSDESLRIVITGNFLEKTYGIGNPLSWDLQNENPPQAKGLSQDTYKLYYLGVGAHVKCEGIGDANSIKDALQKLKDQLKGDVTNIKYDENNNWLFGVDLLLDGSIRASMVLNDPNLYGIHLEIQKSPKGSFLDGFAGLELDLMYKKITKDISMFRVELQLPYRFRKFNLGFICVTIGVMSLEIYTNGNFLIDLGFPHNRNFERSFVIQAGQYIGRGGIYFGILNGETSRQVPKITNGTFEPVITIGIGLSIGLGKSFDFGIIKGGFSIEVVGIFEGVFANFHPYDNASEGEIYYKAKATVGIVGRLYLSVDFKIIVINASVEISAFATITLEAYKAMIIELDLALKLKAYIKILFIKIRFSFSFSYHASFVIGKETNPPWIVAASDTQQKRDFRTSKMMMRSSVSEQNDVNRRLWIDAIETENSIETKEKVCVKISPSVTVDLAGENESDAKYTLLLLPFITIGDNSDFSKFSSGLNRWFLKCISTKEDGYVYINDIRAIEGDFENKITFDKIKEIFNSYIDFTIEIISTLPETKTEMQAAIFPMFPDLKITLTDTASSGYEQTINYRTDTLVDEAYIDKIHEYFKKLMMLQQKETQNGLDTIDKKAFTEYFVEEYITGILKQIHDFVKNCFTRISYDCTNKTLNEIFDEFYTDELNFDEKIEELLKENQNNKLTCENITCENITMQNTCQTLKKLKDLYHLDVATMLNELYDTQNLLVPSITLDLPEYNFENTKDLPKDLVAAIFFVRYYEDLITGDYTKQLSYIFGENEILYGWQETENYERSIKTSETEFYLCLRGDTAQRLAKVCYVRTLKSGVMPQWDAFKKSVEDTNGKIPTSTVILKNQANIGDLFRRLFPDKDAPATHLIYDTSILMPHASIQWEQLTLPSKDKTIATLQAKYQLTAENLFNALANITGCMGEKCIIPFADKISVENLTSYSMDSKNVENMATSISRFYLQGLRLPSPSIDETETVALYRLLKQELDLPNIIPSELSYTLKASDPAQTWLTIATDSGTIDMAEPISNCPSKILKTPFIKDNEPKQSPYCLDAFKTYNSKEVLPVQTMKIDFPLIHIMSQDVMTDGLGGSTEQTVSYEAYTSKGKNIDFVWGCVVSIRIKKRENEPYVYEVLGADSQTRDLLYQISNQSNMKGELFYKAGAAQAIESGCYQDTYKDDDILLIKQNLSLETKSGFESQLDSMDINDQDTYVATIDQPDFVKLLWQCSVVQGEYLLHYKTEQQTGFSDTIFDDNNIGNIFFVIYETTHNSIYKEGYNCILTKNLLDKSEHVYLKGIENISINKRKQCVYEAGVAGIEFKTSWKEENTTIDKNSDSYKQWLTQSLYHIASYKILGDSNYTASDTSYPLLPTEEKVKTIAEQKTDNIPTQFCYGAKIPLFRYAKEQNDTQNVYAGLGKSATVKIKMRDVYGNDSSDEHTVIVKNVYHDAVYSVTDIPYSELSYELIHENATNNYTFTITIESQLYQALSDQVENVQSMGEQLHKISCQYNQQDMNIYGIHSLIPQKASLDKNILMKYLKKSNIFLTYYKKILPYKASEDSISGLITKGATYKELAINNGKLADIFTDVASLKLQKTIIVHPQDSLSKLLGDSSLYDNWNDNVRLQVNKVITVPTQNYIVIKDDKSFAQIAKNLNIPLKELIESNKEKPNLFVLGSIFKHGDYEIAVQENDTLSSITDRMKTEHQLPSLTPDELLLDKTKGYDNDSHLKFEVTLTYTYSYTKQGDTLAKNASGMEASEFVSANKEIQDLLEIGSVIYSSETLSVSEYANDTLEEISKKTYTPISLLLELWKDANLKDNLQWQIGTRKHLPEEAQIEDENCPYIVAPTQSGGYTISNFSPDFYNYNNDIMYLVDESKTINAFENTFTITTSDTIASMIEKIKANIKTEKTTEEIISEICNQTFLKETFKYLYAVSPETFAIAFNPENILRKTIQSINMEWECRRTQYLEHNEDGLVSCSKCVIPLKTDKDGSVKDFVADMETINGIHIATSGQQNKNLFAIVFGEDTLGTISINATPANKIYSAIKPLSRHLLSREGMLLKTLTKEGTLSEGSIEKSFFDIDIELWANNYLKDFDEVLESQLFVEGSVKDLNIANNLITHKNTLITAILNQLESVKNGILIPESDELKKMLKNRLGVSLWQGYQQGAYLKYTQSCTSESEKKVRLVMEITDTNATGNTILPGKIDTNSNGYCMQIVPPHAYISQLDPTLTYKITELEYDIEQGNNDGYERSKWLQFYSPITNKNEKSVSITFDKDKIPIPLREYPQKPMMDKHLSLSAETAPTQGILWEYQFIYTYQLASQDTIEYTLTFNDPAFTTMRYGYSKDLFDTLAQYELIRIELMEQIKKGNGKSLDAFVDLTGEIASTWNCFDNANNLMRGFKKREEKIKLHFSLENESLLFTCLDEIWDENTSVYYLKDSESYQFEKIEDKKYKLPDTCIVEPGTPIKIQLSYKKLDIKESYSVNTQIQIHRNQNLFENPNIKVNPNFIYHREPVSYSAPVFAYYRYSEEYKLGDVTETVISVIAESISKLLFKNSLPFKETDIEFTIQGKYFYQLTASAPRIYLPLLMIPQTTYGEQLQGGIAQRIQRFLTDTGVTIKNAGVEFSVGFMYQDRVIAEIDKIVIKINTDTDTDADEL